MPLEYIIHQHTKIINRLFIHLVNTSSCIINLIFDLKEINYFVYPLLPLDAFVCIYALLVEIIMSYVLCFMCYVLCIMFYVDKN